ncbi:MAG: hypothetical protein P4L31_08165 [Candidatus Babeliales bacterium]|nr:hypothetical protein [Candidatus Babeliales bacterium]
MKFNRMLMMAMVILGSGISVMIGQKMSITKKEVGSHPAIILDRAVKVRYKNYRGEVAVRSIVPMELYWGETEYHPHDQWLLKVYDIEKNTERIYAFKDIQEFDVK